VAGRPAPAGSPGHGPTSGQRWDFVRRGLLYSGLGVYVLAFLYFAYDSYRRSLSWSVLPPVSVTMMILGIALFLAGAALTLIRHYVPASSRRESAPPES
jgi:hypothetical protein